MNAADPASPTPPPQSSKRLRSRLWLIPLWLFTVGAGWFGMQQERRVEEGVQLLVTDPITDPTTTFELRFDGAMVDGKELGKVADPCPLVIEPQIKGEFKWLSTRSGVFTPSEPPALGATYRFTLRHGLKRSDETPSPARLIRVLGTPPFKIIRFSPRRFDTNNAPSHPAIRVRLNADVDPQKAAEFLTFRSADGQQAPLNVERAVPYSSWSDYPDDYAKDKTWMERFHHKPEKKIGRRSFEKNENQPAPPETISSMLLVTPRTLLPVGKGWQLVIAPGLPAADGKSVTQSNAVLNIGNVTPFSVAESLAHNEVDGGKSITIHFSKQIYSDLAESDLDLVPWVGVTPQPAHFSLINNADSIIVSGDFSLSERYAITIKAGFPAVEPFTLSQTWSNTFTFAPLPPRLYFPAFSNPQLRDGQRRLDLLVVNVPQVRIRARKLDANNLIHALRGYEGYIRDWNESDRNHEPYREIDFNVMPGTRIFKTNILVRAAADEKTRIPLNWDTILGKGKPGAVFLVAERDPESDNRRATLGTQALVQVTDLGVLTKRNKTQTWVYVFSHSSGKPVSGATVRLLNDDNTVLEEGKTDGSGTTTLLRGTERTWLLIESVDDLYVQRMGDGNLYPYNPDIPFSWQGEDAARRRVLMFSDRGVYQPGEIVHLKVIVRDWLDQQLVLPPNLTGKLQLFDPKGNVLLDKDVRLMADGALSESIRIAGDKVGCHRIELNFDGQIYSHHFQVQEYEPNPFEIKIGARNAYAAGAKIELPVTASYFMGKTLSKAKLKWSLQADDRGFSPAGLQDYAFCSQMNYCDLGQSRGSLALNGQGVLSEKGALLVTPEIPINSKAPQPRQCNLLVEISDIDQKTVSESSTFVRHSSDFYLGLRRLDDVIRIGDALPVNLIAVKPDGTPWPRPVQADVALTRVEWRTVRIKGAGGSIAQRSEPGLIRLQEIQVPTRGITPHGTGFATVPSTKNSAALRPDQPGLYLIEAKTKDDGGREVLTSVAVNICGKGATSWNYSHAAQLELIPDKSTYLEGDTATLLVKTPITGTAWVTIEREKVLRSFNLNLSGNAPVIRVPIQKGDAPNVFVSVVLIRGTADSTHQVKQPEFRHGYCRLNVTKPESRLTVLVRPNAAEYRPGQKVRVDVAATDAAGRPAADSEVTLYAVDEGVLSLAGYTPPDPHSFFHQIRPLAVHTALSLPSLFNEDAEQWTFSNKGYLIGDGGGAEATGLRKKFLACAFWNATLRTDEHGRLQAQFVAPDGLTRYRVIAVAHTRHQQFGSGESQFAVNKPLMIEPALPRFACIGDQIMARGVIHNQTDLAGQVEVRLELDDKAGEEASDASRPAGTSARPVSGKISRTVKVAPRQTVAVEFPLEFREAGTATWTWQARLLDAKYQGAAITDAVETKLHVGYPVALLREIHVGHTRAAETNLIQNANPQLLEGRGNITVQVSNTRLSELTEAIQHLLHYPYGCVEQTTSSLLPWIVLKEVRDAFPSLSKKSAEFDEVVQKGIGRLLSMQTESGGLSYWPGGREPMLWGSAYGGLGLALARKHGHSVPLAALDQLTKHLSGQLRNTADLHNDYELRPGCLTLYTLALADKPEPAYQELIFQKRAALSAESRAILALAILESKGDSKMVAELLKPQKTVPPEADFWFGCATRELATRLMAWCQHQPSDRAVDVLVEELMKARREGHWWTTQGNAWALMALGQYVKNVETERKPTTGSLSWGNAIKPFGVDRQKPGAQEVFALQSSAASLPLRLLNPQQALLFTSTKVEARPRAWQQPRQDRGYSIDRSYRLVEDDGTLKDLGVPRVGDRVMITLQIEARDSAHCVAIEDPLPATFEALHPEFKSQATRAGQASDDGWFSDYHELREDRVLFFRDHLPPGRHTIRYVARVRAAGNATAPAAKIEEMYHPERFGLSATAMVKTAALN